MPLMRGKSRKAISQNIRELVKKYKRAGKIGEAKPEDLEHARSIAAAAAYSKARGK